MTSLILRTATRYLAPIMLLFSVYLLLRGHNAPGGGFSGGLTAASAFTLYALAYDVPTTLKLIRVHPIVLAGVGLLMSCISGMIPMLWEKPFLTGFWLKIPLTKLSVLEMGTPLVFDTGVYLVVIGVTLVIILSLAEEAP